MPYTECLGNTQNILNHYQALPNSLCKEVEDVKAVKGLRVYFLSKDVSLSHFYKLYQLGGCCSIVLLIPLSDTILAIGCTLLPEATK